MSILINLSAQNHVEFLKHKLNLYLIQRGDLGNKVNPGGHFRKRSVSGKMIGLYCKGERSPSPSVNNDSYLKRFVPYKPYMRNVEQNVYNSQNNKNQSNKRKKKKRNSSNPFTLNIFPQDSETHWNYAETFMKKLKKKKKKVKMEDEHCGCSRVLKKEMKNRKYALFLNPI